MLKNLNVDEFTAKTASNEPVPGGGSVAALSGALASSLGAMVANLTIGKKKYIEVEEDMKKIASSFEDKRVTLLNLIDEDAESFNAVMKGFKLPKETDEDKKTRKEYLQKSFKEAAKVPLEIAAVSAELFDGIEILVKKGNQNAVTDGLVAAMMARTAILSALLNVKINLGSIKDEEFVEAMNKKIEILEKLATNREEKILELVKF
ncbi:MAG: cyclodeaminase/cyclohydrolase family protein [Tissierellales bacterium]|jgi:formiminotetrahydrofolate cyclodeaminase|nr:cyclodeaminase/cyclohydrolase family protein [Tissierellales bacterium]